MKNKNGIVSAMGMNLKEAFQSIIRETPSDEVSYLVYTDWLDEQGKGLAATMLRQHVALKQTGPDDARWKEVIRLQKQLTKEHPAEWQALRERVLPYLWNRQALEQYGEHVAAALGSDAIIDDRPSFAVFFNTALGLPNLAVMSRVQQEHAKELKKVWPQLPSGAVTREQSLRWIWEVAGWEDASTLALYLRRRTDMAKWRPDYLSRRYDDYQEQRLEQGINVDAKNWTGYWERPLHHAVRNGRADAVHLLLNYGADINADDQGGATPLTDAIHYHPNLASLLVDRGADVNAKTGDLPPLHCAARRGDVETMRLLIEHGAKVNAKDNDGGCTPLHRAAREGHIDAMQLLFNHDALVNAPDRYKDTPLHEAVYSQSAEAVQLLLDRGANPRTQNAQGVTPADEASRYSSKAIAELLRTHMGHDRSLRR